ncbi:MAG: N-acylneuraminate cytidylyltransferase [Parcubacteria group bacterium Gr01-1014_66]|nr:MAG: N-acylneuraminate cytidylyltransferase [Parcubacteria group bacterium Gr01-1014_66]
MSVSPRHILGVITARGGSKSIPKKSIAPCAGNPLLFYTIRAAQESKLLNRIIISTDDEEMANVAQSHGIEVPFMRPAALAQDLTPDLPVFMHALETLKEKEKYNPEIVVHLRPTGPLRPASGIDRAIQLIMDHPEADAVHAMCEPHQPPIKMATMGEDGYLRPLLAKEFPDVFERMPEPFNMPRQLIPKVWRHSPLVDAIRTTTIADKHLMSGERILPIFFETWRDIDIDSRRELLYAELVISAMRAQGKEPWEEWSDMPPV